MSAPPVRPARRSPRNRFADDRRGAASIEVALIFPVFLLALFGIAEFGRAMWIQATLQRAVSQAARCAKITPSQCTDVPAYAAAQAPSLGLTASNFTYTTSYNCAGSGSANGVDVAASYQFNTVVAALIPSLGSITLTASECRI